MAVEDRHALAVLIDAVEQANGWADEDVAQAARLRGHQLSKSNVSRVRNEPVISISVKLLTALADGLQLPLRQVLQASLMAMGTPVGEPPSRLEDVILSDEQLSARDRRVLLSVLVALREPDDGTATSRAAKAAPVAKTRDDRRAQAKVRKLLATEK